MQHHFRMLLKRLACGIIIVLAAYCEQNAAALELKQPALQIGECRAVAELTELDAVDAVITDHAAPERIVQIDDHAFLHAAGQRRHRIENPRCDDRQRIGADGHFREIPCSVLIECISAELCLNAAQCDRINIRIILRGGFGEQQIQLPHLKRKG